MKTEPQIRHENQMRHEKLIEFLNQSDRFKDKGRNPTGTIVKKEVVFSQMCEIPHSDISKAIAVFIDYLNLSGGSVGDVDLYRLLEVYFLQPNRRAKINQVLNGSL